MIDFRMLYRKALRRLNRKHIAFTPEPRRYPRAACPVCGKMLVQTSKGAWRHKCESQVTP